MLPGDGLAQLEMGFTFELEEDRLPVARFQYIDGAFGPADGKKLGPVKDEVGSGNFIVCGQPQTGYIGQLNVVHGYPSEKTGYNQRAPKFERIERSDREGRDAGFANRFIRHDSAVPKHISS